MHLLRYSWTPYEQMNNVTLFGSDFLSDLQQNELDQRTLEESNA